MSDNDSQEKDFAARIGDFFLLLGFILFLLFAWSDQTANNARVAVQSLQYKMLNKNVINAPNFDYFFMSLISIGIGVYLRRRVAPPPPAERFQSLRKFGAKRRAKKESKSKRE